MAHLPGRARLVSRMLPRTLGCILLAASACLALPGSAVAATSSLTTDANGLPLVDATDLAPGHVLVRCVQVSTSTTYTSADLALYATATGGLADHLDVTVETGTGGSFADCTGFTGTQVFSGTLTELADTYTASSPERVGHFDTSDSSVTLRLSFTVEDDNAVQGETTSAAFWWLPVASSTTSPPPPAPSAGPATPTTTTLTTSTPTTTTLTTTTPTTTTPTAAGTPTSSRTPGHQGTSPTTRPATPSRLPSGAGSTSASEVGVVRTTPTGSNVPAATAVAPAPAPSASALAPAVGIPLTGGGPGPGSTGSPPKSPAGWFARLVSGLSSAASRTESTLAAAARPALAGAALGTAMILPLLLLFLLVQRWIDRRDPKLALAPAYSEPFLGFSDRKRFIPRQTNRQGDQP